MDSHARSGPPTTLSRAIPIFDPDGQQVKVQSAARLPTMPVAKDSRKLQADIVSAAFAPKARSKQRNTDVDVTSPPTPAQSSGDEIQPKTVPIISKDPPRIKDVHEKPVVPRSPSTTSEYDVYARPYVPEVLKAINNAPARQITSQPIKKINFKCYIKSFAGNTFISAKLERRTPVQIQDHNPLPRPDCFPDKLTSTIYKRYWSSALLEETTALSREVDAMSLWEVAIGPKAPKNQRAKCVGLCLSIPGLRESSIRIEVGDNVCLRQIRVDPRTGVLLGYINPYGEQAFSGIEYVAVITGIDRRQEMIDLRVDGLQPESMRFNVRFCLQQKRLDALQEAVLNTATSLDLTKQSAGTASWLNSMLFPSKEDTTIQTELKGQSFRFQARDTALNFEQIRAIDSIISSDYGTLPFLISGPPGTGKTKTLVEAVLQLVLGLEKHILVCAPSDPAADTIALRLSPHLKPSQLLRLNDPHRTFAEVPESLLVYCCIDNDLFSIPSFADLMRCRVVVTTCRDADLLIQAHVTNADLANLEMGLLSALHPQAKPPVVHLHWSGLVLDEAAQATEPEALIPISVVRPPDARCYDEEPALIMAGDQKQFNPRTASKGIAIGTSLFERLLDRPLYTQHPLARSRLRNGEVPMLTRDMLPMIRPPFATLVRNYRSHSAILAIPSALFYNDTLLPEAANTNSLRSWAAWRGRRWPVMFCENTSVDEVEGEGGGWFNVGEAHKALWYARSLVDSMLLDERNVCIISPFQAQVRLLRNLARSHYKLWGVNIGPLEAFQGLESGFVILCTTRARDRFLDQDIAKGLGVIHEAKRFNVALTRAKQGLVVIGNPLLLSTDNNWNAFLSFCYRHGLWDVAAIDDSTHRWKPEDDGVPAYISRLETALIFAEDRVQHEHNGHGMDDVEAGLGGMRFGGVEADHAMWTSGLAAEAALRDE